MEINDVLRTIEKYYGITAGQTVMTAEKDGCFAKHASPDGTELFIPLTIENGQFTTCLGKAGIKTENEAARKTMLSAIREAAKELFPLSMSPLAIRFPLEGHTEAEELHASIRQLAYSLLDDMKAAIKKDDAEWEKELKRQLEQTEKWREKLRWM